MKTKSSLFDRVIASCKPALTAPHRSLLPVMLLALSLTFISCSDDSANGPDPVDPVETISVFVSNEGNFSDANGSITRYGPADGNTLQQAFQDANDRPLGGIIQSAQRVGEQLYIVLNEANKIEVTDAETLESAGTISLSTTPVAIEVIDGETAYVANLYSGSLSVIDLTAMEETDRRIPVGSQPHSLKRVGDNVYVANKGAGDDNTVSVIPVGNGEVSETIEVGAGPQQIHVDAEDRLWVVCNGRVAYDDSFEREPENDLPGSVYILDGQTGAIIGSVETGGHPSAIALNEDEAEAYLLNEGVSVIDMNTFEQIGNLTDRSFNGIGYFEQQQQLYLGLSKGYDQEGQAVIYDLQGTPVDSFATGIAPNGFIFP